MLTSLEQMEAGLYMLKMHHYDQWHDLDIHPECRQVDITLKISIDALRAACHWSDHELIVEAVESPGWFREFLEHTWFGRRLSGHCLPPIKQILISAQD